MRQEPVTTLRGLDALQSAMRDPSVPIFRERWGRLERIDLHDAAALAAAERHSELLVEVQA
jgi:hypothetical protein